MNYEVGYRRPPKATQFQAGKTGNPRGRPKGSKNFATLLDQALGESVTVNDGGKRKKVTKLHAMVLRLVSTALQGDIKTVLTVVEVMRKTGHLQLQEPESFLPDEYQSILDAYVAKRTKGSPKVKSI